MSVQLAERLYQSLPALYRRRDFEQGEPLRALMAIVERELQAVERDIEGLYENWFIETCDEWVIPYIGDLLGIQGLEQATAAGLPQRARVANTIGYRRRKGTLPALERLIRDVTGWSARAVEFYDLVAATQHLERVRPGKSAWFDMHNERAVELLGGPFETVAHTADLRSISTGAGRHNLGNLGVFLWRLQSYGVERVPAAPVTDPPDGRYTFHPLEHDAPLFVRPAVTDGSARAAAEEDLPGPMSPAAFQADLASYTALYGGEPDESRPDRTAYYGPGQSVALFERGKLVPPARIMAQDLVDWTRPPVGVIAVDVQRGRIAFPSGEDPIGNVDVSYRYGFSADLGGGPYDRQATLSDLDAVSWSATVSKGGKLDTLQKALEAWSAADTPDGVIRVTDSATYGGDLLIELPERGTLTIEAADGVRPVVRLLDALPVTVTGDEPARLTLNGLLVEGGIVLRRNVALGAMHCTLLPGRLARGPDGADLPARPAIAFEASEDSPSVAAASAGLEVHIHHSIVGSIHVPAGSKRLEVRDSIVGVLTAGGHGFPAIAGESAVEGADDAATEDKIKLIPCGPRATIARSTVFGPASVQELTLASEAIFTGPIHVERRQVGCARFSYVPEGSRSPRRFRCQPDLALDELRRRLGLDHAAVLPDAERTVLLARLEPRFTSVRYGDPGLAQLASDCAVEIRTGAENGSEMGVFGRLGQPEREAQLRSVIEQYTPASLSAGTFIVT